LKKAGRRKLLPAGFLGALVASAGTIDSRAVVAPPWFVSHEPLFKYSLYFLNKTIKTAKISYGYWQAVFFSW
jgi:hypothetical protein